MTIKIRATYDGKSFVPKDQVNLPKGTDVTLTVEEEWEPEEGRYLFFKAARALNLEGPSDWSERYEEYLYPDPDRPPLRDD
jgi:AF2212-like